MRQWTWVLVAAGLGMTACKDSVQTESGRLGDERQAKQEAVSESQGAIGGEDLAEQEFFGTITSLSGNSFTVRDDNGIERPFRVEQDTRFMSEGQPVTRGQLREGAQIRTTYDEKDGQFVADQVELYAGTPSRDAPAPSGTEQK
ncbi:hypothetical protein HPC49_24605 [Pyxidicoccus fallax]|uniref:DUF5666 domain-containing protein n=1 Tax=Pyxidicoccus fallax TaxID=394095 RepID=A0A848LLY7_9BACT|nr:DUF5666 domain-containing protein [Pyxidicoccus fallax]NMO18709.1 hypothetical protein [Pyxidicoccus fallax]NPC81399.1 hypothetical protein [Pyxidicoccus fallax]